MQRGLGGSSGGLLTTGGNRGGSFDALADAHVGCAAAEIPRHGAVDVIVVGLGVVFEERGRRHNLPCLAVSALGDVEFTPRLLEGMKVFRVGGETLNRGNFHSTNGGDWCHAGARGDAIEMDRTSPALAHAATVLSSDEFELIAEHPQHGGLWGGVHATGLAVDVEGVFHRLKVSCRAVEREAAVVSEESLPPWANRLSETAGKVAADLEVFVICSREFVFFNRDINSFMSFL